MRRWRRDALVPAFVFALGLATILGAWISQLGFGYVPCALCLQQRIPYYVEMATRHAIYGRPGATYLDMPDDIIRGTCALDKVVEVGRVPEPPRMVAPGETVEAALTIAAG